MWKAAIKLGWATQRTDMFRVKQHMEGYDFIRYYGNTLHAAQIKDQLPFKFLEVPACLSDPRLGWITRRKIQLMTYAELKQPIEKDCFIKPVHEKWFEAKVYRAGESIAANGCLPTDEIYVQEIVKFVDEVRCFVLGNEILTSSLYRIGSVAWDATNEKAEDINFDTRIRDTCIPQYVKWIREYYPYLPKGVVLDFGLTENGDWSFVEPNESYASGLYYCSPEKCLEVIMASQENI
jgi:hypothetical protein